MRIVLFALCLLVVHSVHAQVSQRYELVKMGTEINTQYDEAAPVVSPDGKDLYFFVSNHPENTYGKENSQDIWVSHKDDKGWTAAKRLGSPLNQNRMNQVFNVLPDGSLFVRGGRSKDEIGFSIVSKGGSKTELKVQDFKDMCKGRFYGATMSSDQKHMILYFSEAPLSIKSDLYVSNNLGDNWSRPVKLNITDGNDEYGPFLDPNDKALYYVSDRSDPHKVGGSDIYKADRLDDSWAKWSKPTNMKKPINTIGGDSYFAIDREGHVFTTRANARIDGGNLDLYVLVPKNIKITLAGSVKNATTQSIMPATDVKVALPAGNPLALKSGTNGKFESVIPEVESYTVAVAVPGFLPYNESFKVPVINNDTTLNVDIFLTPVAKPKQLALNGTVFDKKTNAPIESKVDVISRAANKPLGKIDAAGGKYSQDLSSLGWYVLTASSEGYLNSTDSIEIESNEVTPVTKDLYLQKIEVGLTVKLKNIYFDYDKTTLKSESFVELDKVQEFLTVNPRVEVEIGGHTDNKGSDEYNANLSQGRSQSVVDYLVNQGINRSRLTAHGYGESKPIDTNDTKEGQANNRRVEFTVVKN
jgi:OOP family OmpA-OmpF porin